MLEEHEWEQVLPRLEDGVQQIKDYRRKHNATLAEAKDHVHDRRSLDLYAEIAGFPRNQR
jgi:hypothetical protein